MGADQDAFRLQRRENNGAGGHQGRGNPAAEMAAAAVVLKAVIFRIGGQIRVSRPGGAPMIVFAAGIRVGNQDGQGCAGGTAFEDAADDAEGICLPPGSGDFSRGAAEGKLGGDKGLVHRKPRGYTVKDRADFGAVALAEEGH